MSSDLQKPWQHGFPLSTLKELESFYESHNRYALSVFGKFKKNDIASRLHDGTLHIVSNATNHPLMSYVAQKAKVCGKITMFGDVIIGEKEKGDITLSRLCGDAQSLSMMLKQFEAENCWALTFAGNVEIRDVLEESQFVCVGYKVTSFSEIISVYYRNSSIAFSPRQHPIIAAAELVGMAKIADVDTSILTTLYDTLKKLAPTFTNHYSNYNVGAAWSAISLRGYLNDPGFITKPEEMNDKWKQQYKDFSFGLQDTELYQSFPEVRDLLSFLDGDIHRVRFMRLSPGGGELQRHTDQVDPDAGNGIGKLARLHFPIKTNPQVVFSTWNRDDVKEDYHYGFGECWIIDTRKPHMAINGGMEERIHLVVDTIVTPKLERMICEGISRQIT